MNMINKNSETKSLHQKFRPVINKGIYGDTKVKTAFKLAPGRSLNATKSMSQHLTKLSKISNAVSKGGLVLAGVGLASSCYQISQTEAVTEKNVIAVKTITSTGVGAVAGTVATIMLVGTPVGWGIILLVGAATVVTSWAPCVRIVVASNFYLEVMKNESKIYSII